MANVDSTESKMEYKEDALETLISKAGQLSAMLYMITGQGFQSFKLYNDTIKENYISSCANYAEEIGKLAAEIDSTQNA